MVYHNRRGATLEREQQLAQAFDHAVHVVPLAEPAD
jgi:hypothetical protein